jgi:hypothetical protein
VVELLIHLHDGDACLLIAPKDGARYGRRPSMPRQQRSVHIHDPVARDRQHRRWDDLPVSDDNHHIRRELPQSFDDLRIAYALWLEDLKAQLLSGHLDRRRRQLQAPARGTIRLRHDQLDLVPGFMQRSKRRHGELGRAGEDDIQESA